MKPSTKESPEETRLVGGKGETPIPMEPRVSDMRGQDSRGSGCAEKEEDKGEE
jgi:hypothetical protein